MTADGAGGGAGSAESDAAGRDASATAAAAAPDDPDAVDRLAHGATVSVPSILLQRGLMVAFTAVLTNGFGAGSYGLFALARRLQRFLRRLSMGFRNGLSRYLPTAESDAERDLLITVGAVLLVGSTTVFGAALYLAAPAIADLAGEGGQFRLFLRIFAAGLPVTILLYVVTETLRGLEAVAPFNLALRIGFPVAQLGVGVVGTVLLDDLALVAVGVVAAMGLTGLVAAGWLVRSVGVRPRWPDGPEWTVWRRYVRYTVPLFANGIAMTTQRLGFYPLIVLYLSGVAGGVFAVGILLGRLVRLPLAGINQFIPPVAAALHDEGHRVSLQRLYHVTSRLVLTGVTAIAVPLIVYRVPVMGLFGPTFVEFAPLLPGFVVAQYAACGAGSVGILLMMTDNQRAILAVNLTITAFLIVTAVPLTITDGLPGLVVSYVLMLTVNNAMEVAALYYLEGLQPLTRRHARPLVAAVPFVGIALAARTALSSPAGPVVGTVLGVAAYAVALSLLGFTPVERRLGATLLERYRTALGRALPGD
ncbi:MAG: lipopolysaccharide biosynthesis protein [Halobacteriaceae archaeon]